eukprot:gene23642-28638_t
MLKHSDSVSDVAALSEKTKPRSTPALATIPDLSGPKSTGQTHENDLAQVVIVCEPDLTNSMMGSIHPHGALYEKPVDLRESQSEHAQFRQVLRERGVMCLTVHQILLHDCDTDLRARQELEDLARSRLEYKLDTEHDLKDLSETDAYYLSDQYKRHVLETMSVAHLLDMVLCKPTVFLKPSYRDTGKSTFTHDTTIFCFTASYAFNPLTNMQYTRDQQITTAKGVVMGRLRSLQRKDEVELMEFCFRKLGLNIVGTVKEPGYLEGGDFYPAGENLCFIGIGLRSNLEASQQLMREDLFGTSRVAVV